MLSVLVVICSLHGKEFIVHVAVANLEGDPDQHHQTVQLSIENQKDSCTSELENEI